MTPPQDNAVRDSTKTTLRETVSRTGMRLWSGALSLVYPPQCNACQAATAEAHALCPACWSTLPLIAEPVCARLGTPFEHDFGPGMLSPAAIADPPRFESARAVALHDGLARSMVTRLKYGERLDLARSMARLMAGAGREMLAGCDMIVPVPMHRGRLWQRRYNQAALLALEIGKIVGKPVAMDCLIRIKRTPPQVGLTRNERRANLAGAFRVPPQKKALVEGRHLVVIDDVRTTGSTLNASAHILAQAGAARVDVLTFTLVAHGMA
jgi:ComF family protein